MSQLATNHEEHAKKVFDDLTRQQELYLRAQIERDEIKPLKAEIDKLKQKLKFSHARIAVLASRYANYPIRDQELDEEIHRLNLEEEQSGLYRDEQAEHIIVLEKRIKELERDKKRLDWILENAVCYESTFEARDGIDTNSRDVIDKLMKESE